VGILQQPQSAFFIKKDNTNNLDKHSISRKGTITVPFSGCHGKPPWLITDYTYVMVTLLGHLCEL